MQSVKFWISIAVLMVFAASCVESSMEIITEVPEETAPEAATPEPSAAAAGAKQQQQARNFRYDEKIWNLDKRKGERSPVRRSR